MYSDVFFLPEDLAFVQKKYQPIVKEHFLGRAGKILTSDKIKYFIGIEEFLEGDEIIQWIDSIIRGFFSKTPESLFAKTQKEKIKKYLIDSAGNTSIETDEIIKKRFDDWITHFKNQNIQNSKVFLSNVEELQNAYLNELASF